MPIDAISRMLNKNKSEDVTEQVYQINLNLLQPNPYQPRKQFDAIQLDELSRSIAEIGVIQPIVVRQTGTAYEIVAGERRWRAAKNAGLHTIPALIRQFTDRELAEVALIENLQRADLGYFEEAEGFRRLIEEFHLTQEEVAKRVGKSQPTVANKLRILRIDPKVRENIMVELLSERHVRSLLRLKTPEEQLFALKEIYEKELNVKDTEQFITDFLAGRVSLDDEKEGEEEEDAAGHKRKTTRRISSDLRIYVNTIKAAVTTVLDAGVDVKMAQTETAEGIQLTITIPYITKQ